MIALLTGGSGCGKSTYAERLVRALPGERRIYLATMQVRDEESVHRVARHRAQRANLGFETIERDRDIGALDIPAGSVVLLEDLVNLVAGEMFSGGDVRRIAPALDALGRRCRHLIMVTNDVFSDGIRYGASTQAYLRALAQVNRHAAAMADYAAEVVHSIPVPLKGEAPCGL